LAAFLAGYQPKRIPMAVETIKASITEVGETTKRELVSRERIQNRVEKSGLFRLLAENVTKVLNILKIEKPPKFGLLNGFIEGKLNYLGYCWEEDDGQRWIGLDEFWIDTIANTIADHEGKIPETIRQQISFVIAEEAFHARIHETHPDLAEDCVKANESGDPNLYWSNPVEVAAKKFALIYSITPEDN